MTKNFCDCCGENLVGRVYKFSYFVHIKQMCVPGSQKVSNSYTDNYGNRVSEREEMVDLCISCYNKLFVCAYTKFIELSTSCK